MNYMVKKAINMNGQDFLMQPMDIDYAHRTLWLTGEIDDEAATALNAALRCLARDSDEDIVLYIQSPGGSVSAGFSIYDTIHALRPQVCTVACGIAASMAAFLLSAAGTKGKRYAQPNAEILIHQPLGSTRGQASDILIHAEHMLYIKEKLNRILAEATGQTVQKMKTDTDRDNILDAQAALAYGLVDKIGDPASEW